MAITKKLRFDILQRDGHSCMYCGRKPPYVMLEVDHIIPKKEGGLDIENNLITSCFDCNRGKGGNSKRENESNIYKRKIKDKAFEVKQYFQNRWNQTFMGSIDKNTYILLMFYINHHMVDDDVYMTWLDCPLISPPDIDNKHNIYALHDLFTLGGEYCDEVLSTMYHETIRELDGVIEEVFTDSNWKWNNDKDYCKKLNYYLTDYLLELYENKTYIIKKFTLFPSLITNG